MSNLFPVAPPAKEGDGWKGLEAFTPEHVYFMQQKVDEFSG